MLEWRLKGSLKHRAEPRGSLELCIIWFKPELPWAFALWLGNVSPNPGLGLLGSDSVTGLSATAGSRLWLRKETEACEGAELGLGSWACVLRMPAAGSWFDMRKKSVFQVVRSASEKSYRWVVSTWSVLVSHWEMSLPVSVMSESGQPTKLQENWNEVKGPSHKTWILDVEWRWPVCFSDAYPGKLNMCAIWPLTSSGFFFFIAYIHPPFPKQHFSYCLVAQSCLTLCAPMDCSTPGFSVLHYLSGFLKVMSIVLVMPSNHLMLCHPLLLLPAILPSITIFSNESALHIRWAKYWSFSFSISPSNEYPGLISFRMDWLDLLAVQGTLKSLLQQHSSKASIL